MGKCASHRPRFAAMACSPCSPPQTWPFPSQLMLGCQATTLPGGEAIVVDTHELEAGVRGPRFRDAAQEARWVSREEVKEALAAVKSDPQNWAL